MRTAPIVESTKKRGSPRPLIAYCLERATLFFSIKMALVVGTLLAVINHGQTIVTGHFTSDRLLPLLLTYCVPFSVAMYNQIQGKRQPIAYKRRSPTPRCSQRWKQNRRSGPIGCKHPPPGV